MGNQPKTKHRRKGYGRVAFLAQLEQVRKLLDAGWPQLMIYEKLKAKLGISYQQFNRYVRRYLIEEKTDGHQKGQDSGEPTREPPQADQQQPAKRPAHKPGGNGFKHDPTSGNRDDLI